MISRILTDGARNILVVSVSHAIGRALLMAFTMFWDILWGLILGFLLSAIVEAIVSKGEIVRLLPDDRPKTIMKACGLGAASSSCSYAAVALTRSIIRKGANFTSSIAFQLASTNLVAELAVILAVLVGWQFTVAEFLGAPQMVAIMVLLFRAFLNPTLLRAAQEQAGKGIRGRMEGHTQMDMSVTEGTLLERALSSKGKTAISHYFVMNWTMLWMDIGGGLLIAGALAAWIPPSGWKIFFLTSHPLFATFWGPIVGPVVAILSFVCSVGNVPLAAVLWSGGSSFGGIIAFLFADLLVLPILDIYRKYYGRRMMLFLLATLYISMVLAAIGIEFLFRALHLVPAQHHGAIAEMSIKLNYTTVLNIIFLLVALPLVWRFFRTGGPAMLRMMDSAARSN
ncbi:MAG TPA: permease [Terriglobales bacterium]|nr:permease [Terriglobales bacterium]